MKALSPCSLSAVWAVLLVWSAATIAHAQTSSEDAPLRWGPYRPNLYFGVRPQIPRTLLMGLMWANGESQKSMLRGLRDACEPGDGVASFGWSMYDTRTGGIQTVRDDSNHVDISTEFMKTPEGEGWGMRVSGIPRADAPAKVETAVIFHVAVENYQDPQKKDGRTKILKCKPTDALETGTRMVALCEGDDPKLGKYEIRVLANKANKVSQAFSVASLHVEEEGIWEAKSIFTDYVKSASNGQMPVIIPNDPGEGNFHFLQAVVEVPFTIDFIYSSIPANNLLTPQQLTAKLDGFRSSFPRLVDTIFPRTRPFRWPEYAHFTQWLISNLLGGLGFFYGDSMVDLTHAVEYEETSLNFWDASAAAGARTRITIQEPTSLLSLTPSRSFFPRGFLWDEGFHLLPIVEWDFDLAIAVLKSWLSLMDDDGWIAREQILGAEARSRVSEKFQIQYPHHANPPTFTALLLPALLDKITNTSPYRGHHSEYLSSPAASFELLQELYPLLARQHAWFRRTQAGNFSVVYPRPEGAIPEEGFRWRGRTTQYTLTSGLDDYPRADPPHPAELHVDALTWAAAASRSLLRLALYVGDTDADRYAQQVRDAQHNLDALHWSDTEAGYCDATVSIADGGYTHACHVGYVSLLPFLLGLLPADHPRLVAVLDLISDPGHLWSRHGLRSLSAEDERYGGGEDYWRGAVWANFNVLAVQRLHELGRDENAAKLLRDKARRLARQLRRRVVTTVYEAWNETGSVWEQYSDRTGVGRRSTGFTGWTACVLLLMGLEDGGGEDWAHGRGRGMMVGEWWESRTLMGTVAILVVVLMTRRRLLRLFRGLVDRFRRRRR